MHPMERVIRQAIERGELEPGEGVGEPIPDLDNDPDWWVKRWVKREGLSDTKRVRRSEPPDPPSVDQETS